MTNFTNQQKAILFWNSLSQNSQRKALKLIEQYDLVHAINPTTGEYPLSIAAKRGLFLVCEALLQHRADPNSEDQKTGRTPLLSVILDGRYRKDGTKILQLLLKHGADPNRRISDIAQTTPFLVACRTHMRDFSDKMSTLINSGAHIETFDSLGARAAHYGATNSAANMRALVKLGVPVDVKDDRGDTPLHIATQTNDAELFQVLLSAGCDPRVRNNAGFTAMDTRLMEVGSEQTVDVREQMVSRWIRQQLKKEAMETRENLDAKTKVKPRLF